MGSPPEKPTLAGYAVLITALVLGPVGLVLSIVTLVQPSSRFEDRICALIGLVIGLF